MRLFALATVSIAAFLTLNLATLGLLALAVLALLPVAGQPVAESMRQLFVVAVVAFTITVVNALFSASSQTDSFFAWGPLNLSVAGLQLGLAIGVRVILLASAAIVFLASIDPLQLASRLSAVLRVPDRYALSLVIGLRTVPYLLSQFAAMRLAWRGRAVRRDPQKKTSAHAPVVGFPTALLVNAIVRSQDVAATMTSRSFDPYGPRTRLPYRGAPVADWAFVIVATAVVVGALVAPIWLHG